MVVAKGSSAPNLLGKFNDKTAIEADRTTSPHDGNVYFSWSRFTGNRGDVSIYFSRSTDHGVTLSKPMKLSPNIHDVQFPDISVTGNGDVYVTFRQFAAQGGQPDAVVYVKSTDCGKTFSKPRIVTTFTPYDAEDRYPDGPGARDGGDLTNAVQSGYTFFRRDTQVRRCRPVREQPLGLPRLRPDEAGYGGRPRARRTGRWGQAREASPRSTSSG